MNIMDLIRTDTIKVPLEATNKEAAIDELVSLLASAGRIKDAPALKQVVWEREQQRTTGIGEGLAIPHGKTDSLSHLVIALGRPAEPMAFDSIDQKPVQLIVLLASPKDRTNDHIQALSKISRVMLNEQSRRKIYAAPDAATMYDLFDQAVRASS